MFLLHESSQLPQGLFKPIKIICHIGVPNQRNGGMLVSPNNPPGVELYFYANVFFCLGWKTCSMITWLKTLYRIDDSEERWALTPETVQNMCWLTANRKCAQWSLLSVPLLLLRLPFFSKIKKYVISYIIFFLTRLSPVCVFFHLFMWSLLFLSNFIVFRPRKLLKMRKKMIMKALSFTSISSKLPLWRERMAMVSKCRK